MATVMIPFDEFVDNFLDNDSNKASQYETYNDNDDDDDYDIYNYAADFGHYCGDHEHLQPYKEGFEYFACWGGGPEGGFITNGDETYKVNRTWGEPFTVERIDGRIDLTDNNKLRIVPK